MEIIQKFQQWCDEQDENCPLICLSILERIKSDEEAMISLQRTIYKLHQVVINQPKIVRCKDCQHYHKGFCCDLQQKPIISSDDWFCADCKEKEEG